MDLLDSQHADELATLLALHAEGSFAAAGRALNKHPSVLSKRLAALEARLGVRLVERTTRQLRFTDDGLRLVEKVRHAALLIAEAEKEAAQGAREVRGRLRLSMPAALGRRWLGPVSPIFGDRVARPGGWMLGTRAQQGVHLASAGNAADGPQAGQPEGKALAGAPLVVALLACAHAHAASRA